MGTSIPAAPWSHGLGVAPRMGIWGEHVLSSGVWPAVAMGVFSVERRVVGEEEGQRASRSARVAFAAGGGRRNCSHSPHLHGLRKTDPAKPAQARGSPGLPPSQLQTTSLNGPLGFGGSRARQARRCCSRQRVPPAEQTHRRRRGPWGRGLGLEPPSRPHCPRPPAQSESPSPAQGGRGRALAKEVLR